MMARTAAQIQGELDSLEMDFADPDTYSINPEEYRKRKSELQAELSQVGSGASQPPVPPKPPHKSEDTDPQGPYGGKEFIDPGSIAETLKKEEIAQAEKDLYDSIITPFEKVPSSLTQQQIQNEIRQLESDAQDGGLGPDDEKKLTELRGRLSQPPPPGVVQEFSDAINPLLSEFEKAQSQQSQQPAEPPRTKLSTEYDDAVAEIGGIKKEASNTVPSAAKGRPKEKIEQELRDLEFDYKSDDYGIATSVYKKRKKELQDELKGITEPAPSAAKGRTVEQIRQEMQEMSERIFDADSNESSDPAAEARYTELEKELAQVGSVASQPSQPAQTGTETGTETDPEPGSPTEPKDPDDPTAKSIPTGEELEASLYQDFLNPSLPPGAAVDFNEIEVDEDQFITDPEELENLDARYQVADAAGLDVAAPIKPDAASYSAALIEGTPEFEAAKGKVSADSLVGDIQGKVSEEAIAQAQTEELDERATVQYQLEKLFESFEEGKPPPPWAAPAMRAAGAIMAQRGLGRSSMAAAAITQATLESGVQIASQDANKYATIQLANLNNKQQAALQNAMTFAAMDRANLDARMTAAVNNSKAFLAMDLENLKNEQQLKTIDLQNSYQTLFNNQAAENAALQFNAKSQAQVDQFFAELDVQVQNANSNRLAAMKQFNTDQVNSAFRYYDKINDERDRFNTNLQVQIDQSNAVWRREVNTRNTAIQNEENRINAANLLNISTAAQNRLWQKARDEAQWAMQQTENALQRAHQVAMFAQETEFKKEMYEEDFDNSVATSVGAAGFDIIKKILTREQA